VREVFSEFAGFWRFYQWFFSFAFSDRIYAFPGRSRQFHPYIRKRKGADFSTTAIL